MHSDEPRHLHRPQRAVAAGPGFLADRTFDFKRFMEFPPASSGSGKKDASGCLKGLFGTTPWSNKRCDRIQNAYMDIYGGCCAEVLIY